MAINVPSILQLTDGVGDADGEGAALLAVAERVQRVGSLARLGDEEADVVPGTRWKRGRVTTNDSEGTTKVGISVGVQPCLFRDLKVCLARWRLKASLLTNVRTQAA